MPGKSFKTNEDVSTEIIFRPHHFMCSLAFEGKGYSPLFVQNFNAICQTLRGPEGDRTRITVTLKADSICKPCPNRMGEGCNAQEKIDRLDQNHKKALQLQEGDTLTWGEAKERIKQNITLEKFEQLCHSCEWQELGMCRRALEKLLVG